MKKLYLVETVVSFRMQYFIEAERPEWAADEVVMEEAIEAGQKYLGETIISVREVTQGQARRILSEESDSPWMPLEKVITVLD